MTHTLSLIFGGDLSFFLIKIEYTGNSPPFLIIISCCINYPLPCDIHPILYIYLSLVVRIISRRKARRECLYHRPCGVVNIFILVAISKNILFRRRSHQS